MRPPEDRGSLVPRSSFACSAIAGYGGVILQAGCKTRVQAKMGSSWLPVQCQSFDR